MVDQSLSESPGVGDSNLFILSTMDQEQCVVSDTGGYSRITIHHESPAFYNYF